MKLLLYILSIGIYFLPAPTAVAQVRKLKENSMITGKSMTISITGNYKEIINTPIRKQPVFLYKRDSKGLSLGNVCAEQAMEMYGFRYEIVPERHNISRRKYFFHNFGANIKLWFNNGPFWKARVQKIINKCRQMSGDYVEE